MTKFTEKDFKLHLKSSITSGKMSSEIFVSELAWNPELVGAGDAKHTFFNQKIAHKLFRERKEDVLGRI